MKKAGYILIIVLTLLLVGCGKGEEKQSVNIEDYNLDFQENSSINTDFDYFSTVASLVAYDDIESMVEASDVIISGKVIELEYVVTGVSQVCTVAKIEVKDCYKGDYQKGDIIAYAKQGGITTLDTYWEDIEAHLDPKDNLTKEKAKKITVADYKEDKKTLLEINDKLLIFANNENLDDTGKIPNDAIWSVADQQTEFRIDGYGKIKRYSKDNIAGSMEQSLSDFEKTLKEKVKEKDK